TTRTKRSGDGGGGGSVPSPQPSGSRAVSRREVMAHPAGVGKAIGPMGPMGPIGPITHSPKLSYFIRPIMPSTVTEPYGMADVPALSASLTAGGATCGGIIPDRIGIGAPGPPGGIIPGGT